MDKNRQPIFVRALCAAMAILGGLASGGNAGAQSPIEPGSESQEQPAPQIGGTSAQTHALPGIPKFNPNWRPPALPPGSVAAEEIGSLESRRDHEIDYPREARMARREGTATIGFTIDETGRIADCLILKSSGDPYLDIGSCALVHARGHYKPAHDRNGKALASGRSLEIPWQLGWDVPRPPAESLVRLSFAIREGAFADCWVDRGEGTQGVWHPEMCVGYSPPELQALIRRVAGTGDVRVQSIGGIALSDVTMAEQMALRPGWHRLMGGAAWHDLDENGIAISCQSEAFPGPIGFEDDAACRPTSVRFRSTLSTDGKAAKTRIGTNFAWYVKPLEP